MKKQYINLFSDWRDKSIYNKVWTSTRNSGNKWSNKRYLTNSILIFGKLIRNGQIGLRAQRIADNVSVYKSAIATLLDRSKKVINLNETILTYEVTKLNIEVSQSSSPLSSFSLI